MALYLVKHGENFTFLTLPKIISSVKEVDVKGKECEGKYEERGQGRRKQISKSMEEKKNLEVQKQKSEWKQVEGPGMLKQYDLIAERNVSKRKQASAPQ